MSETISVDSTILSDRPNDILKQFGKSETHVWEVIIYALFFYQIG